jgi:hypothetical protein
VPVPAGGDLVGALDRYQRARALVRETTEAEPGDSDNRQQLESTLHAVGEWQLEVDY